MTAPTLAAPAPAARGLAVSRAHAGVVAGGILVGIAAIAVVFGDRLAPFRATELAGASLEPPSPAHLLGAQSWSRSSPVRSPSCWAGSWA